jgi:S-adenosylmethionine:tRNA ribosyltransferase-isomerase
LRTADFDYDLPPDRIAAAPAAQRDAARLLVMGRTGDAANKHAYFHDVGAHLPPRCLLVLNDTRVLSARVAARKPTGGITELLLTQSISGAPTMDGFSEVWETLGKGLGGAAGMTLEVNTAALGDGGAIAVTATILESREAGRLLVRLDGRGPSSLSAILERIGELPLPPYIEAARRQAGPDAPRVDDRERYQTVYAAVPGAVAAPTAGLHFTPELLDGLRARGHEIAAVTLHVGPGTFRPVKTDDPLHHRMDEERFQIPEATAEAIARARAAKRPIVAVGTTVVRTLEASARAHGGQVVAGADVTDLFILPSAPASALPGPAFAVVDGLITNFHLPRSTLLMLVCAFAGTRRVLAAYRDAVERGYRFYSYGDAMLIGAGRA